MEGVKKVHLKKILLLILIVALLAALFFLGNNTLEMLDISSRESALTPSPTPMVGNVMRATPDPNAPTPQPALVVGSRGEDVQALQEKLIRLGYLSDTADGIYGQMTQSAVKLFQQEHDLMVDGMAGDETRTLLFSIPDPTQEPTATPVPTATPTPTPVPTPSPTPRAQRPYERKDGLPLIVSKRIPLPDDYAPYDLVDMSKYCSSKVVKIKYSGTQAEREAVDALMVMLKAAIDDGVGDWQISAAYRTVKQQKQIMENRVQELMKSNGLKRSSAESAAKKTVADPGSSEHHLGTSFDITVPGTSFAGTKQAKWLEKHAVEYGFIQRYTQEKESITGFLAEAWHYRYVGQEHAAIMVRENLCLEEYVDKYGVDVEDEWW